MATDFEQRYLDDDIPWDTGRVDFNLVGCIHEYSIEPSSTVVIGCGTGSNALWLAEQGFKVTGLDLSETALAIASQKAHRADKKCEFVKHNILTEAIPNTPHSFAFDRGCFHCFGSSEDRALFVQRVYDTLESGGYWLSLIGNADAPKHNPGPPVRSALDIVEVVEPFFEIISLESSHFDSNQDDPPRIWRCLMQRREIY